MTSKQVLLIQGHPDASAHHLCHALAAAYTSGAHEGGHSVRSLNVAELDFPLLRSQKAWEEDGPPDGLQQAQDDIRWAQHIVLFFPLWQGDMPALLKGFLEQVVRPGFAFEREGGSTAFSKKGLTGRSARVVVTMGMPALLYRWYFRAHSVKSLERNILGFAGIAPMHETLIGMVGNFKADDGERWLGKLRRLGLKAQ
ncbi:NAD(P)H-dependent oxidoreductase [Polaromonas sp.]|uniref:NAD(P)H-dependent oxidoreductase n=1 Tax=Polaromonas sp. TaxID=1869339 RepID=UPI002FCB14E7